MNDSAVQVQNVVKRYGTRTILDKINLDVKTGETLVILGGSGSGKSTLLRLMAGLIPYSEGKVVGLGKCLDQMSDDELHEYRKSVGILFQSGALFNSMSVADNVALPLREHTDLAEETIEIMVKIKLELVGLREHSDKMPAELSGGMKKRAALARALILEPEILFLDEPTSGLDSIAARSFDELLKVLHDEFNMTVFMISHDVLSILNLSTDIMVLGKGKMILKDTANKVINSGDPWVHEYFASGVVKT